MRARVNASVHARSTGAEISHKVARLCSPSRAWVFRCSAGCIKQITSSCLGASAMARYASAE